MGRAPVSIGVEQFLYKLCFDKEYSNHSIIIFEDNASTKQRLMCKKRLLAFVLNTLIFKWVYQIINMQAALYVLRKGLVSLDEEQVQSSFICGRKGVYLR